MLNPTKSLIDALLALKDSDPHQVDIEQIIGHSNIHSIFWPVKGHFLEFIDAAEVDFSGIQDRNLAAVQSIVWMLQHGVTELPEIGTFDLDMMRIAGARFSAEYWLAFSRKTIDDLEARNEARLATARLDYDSLVASLQERFNQLDNVRREHRKACHQNDELTRRIAALEAELAQRPPAPEPTPS